MNIDRDWPCGIPGILHQKNKAKVFQEDQVKITFADVAGCEEAKEDLPCIIFIDEILEGQIASLFGGRLAELLIFGDDRLTTGASNDIERATELARKMVTRWGLSDKLGPLTYGEEAGQAIFGQPGAQGNAVSSNVAQMIDEEIRSVIDRNYYRAEKILQDNLAILHLMVDVLMKWETNIVFSQPCRILKCFD